MFEPSQDTAPTHSFSLLVIDDDAIQRAIIARLGKQAGFEDTCAATGFEEAMQMLESRNFDCITLDLSLGEHSGAKLLQDIARCAPFTPVIVISGAEEHVLNSTVALAKSLKLDSKAFPKPLDLAELRQSLALKRQNAPSLRALAQMSDRKTESMVA